MSKWLSEMRAALGTLRMTYDDLTNLGEAFARIGNHEIAREIRDYADAVEQAEDRIDKALNESLNEQTRLSLVNMANSGAGGIKLVKPQQTT